MFNLVIAITFIMIYVALISLFPCKFGLHKWDQPGGHCVDCGKCDEFFGPHSHKEQD